MTQERITNDTKIAILENDSFHVKDSIKRIERIIMDMRTEINQRFDRMDQKIDSNFIHLDKKIDRNFHLILTIIVSLVGTAIGHGLGWF